MAGEEEIATIAKIWQWHVFRQTAGYALRASTNTATIFPPLKNLNQNVSSIHLLCSTLFMLFSVVPQQEFIINHRIKYKQNITTYNNAASR